MKRKKESKLVLNRETVRTLQDDVLDAVAGGCGTLSNFLSLCDTMCDCSACPDCDQITIA